MPNYGKTHTCTGIQGAADGLNNLVEELLQQNRDVRVHIVAHTVGGLIAALWGYPCVRCLIAEGQAKRVQLSSDFQRGISPLQ